MNKKYDVKRFFLKRKEISNEIELKNGRALPSGWSQHEIFHGEKSIGFVENGGIYLYDKDYSFTEQMMDDEEFKTYYKEYSK